MKKVTLIISALALVVFTNCKTSSETEQKVEDMAVESTENGKVLLRVKPKTGTKTDMLFTTTVDSEMAKMNIEMNMNVEVTENTDKDFTYLLDITRINMEGGAGSLVMKYDSDAEATDAMSQQMAQSFKPVLEENMTMVVDELGAVKSIDSKASTGMPNSDFDFSGLSINLPENEVGVGDSWTSNKDLNGIDMNFTMTVTKITPSSVMVDVKGKLNLDEVEDVQVESNGFTGNYEIDRETGLTKFGEIKGGMEAQGQKATITTTFKQI